MPVLKKLTDDVVQVAIKAQAQFCSDNNLDNVAPKDGICPNCGRQVYQRYGVRNTGIEPYNVADIAEGESAVWISSVELIDARTEHVVRCPHCLIDFK